MSIIFCDGVYFLCAVYAKPIYQRVFHIDPSTLPNAIMRRHSTYRGENPDTGRNTAQNLTYFPELENTIGH